MKVCKKNLVLIILALISFVTFMFGFTGFKSASADTVTLSSFNLEMVPGAEVRLDKLGMRFAASMSKDDFDALKSKYADYTFEYGVFIMPVKYGERIGEINYATTFGPNNLFYYGGNTASKVEDGITKYRILHTFTSPKLVENTYMLYATVEGVLDPNIALDYTAKAYIKITNGSTVEYKFADDYPERSMLEVAYRALNSGKFNDDEDSLSALIDYETRYLNNKGETPTFAYNVNYYVDGVLNTSLTETIEGQALNTPVSITATAPSGYYLDESKTDKNITIGHVYAKDVDLTVHVKKVQQVGEKGSNTPAKIAGIVYVNSTAEYQEIKLPCDVGGLISSDGGVRMCIYGGEAAIWSSYDAETNTVLMSTNAAKAYIDTQFSGTKLLDVVVYGKKATCVVPVIFYGGAANIPAADGGFLVGELYNGEVGYLEKTATAGTQTLKLPKAFDSVTDLKVDGQWGIATSWDKETQTLTVTETFSWCGTGEKFCTVVADGVTYVLKLTVADYVITQDSLEKLGNFASSYYIVVGEDIDATGYAVTPATWSSYYGTLDGKGNQIKGLEIDAWSGLMNVVYNPKIRNVAFVDLTNKSGAANGLFWSSNIEETPPCSGIFENVYISGNSGALNALFGTLKPGGVNFNNVILNFTDENGNVGVICNDTTYVETENVITANAEGYDFFGENTDLAIGDFRMTEDGLTFNGKLVYAKSNVVELKGELYNGEIGYLETTDTSGAQPLYLPKAFDTVTDLKIDGQWGLSTSWDKATQILTVTDSLANFGTGEKLCTLVADGVTYQVKLTIAHYVITQDSLEKLGNFASNYYIVVGEDIDATGYAVTPATWSSYYGTLDGKGNQIKGLEIDAWSGLMNTVYNPKVRNVAFVDLTNKSGAANGLFWSSNIEETPPCSGIFENVYISGNSGALNALFGTLKPGGVNFNNVILNFTDENGNVGVVAKDMTYVTTNNVVTVNHGTGFFKNNKALNFGDFVMKYDGLYFNDKLLIEKEENLPPELDSYRVSGETSFVHFGVSDSAKGSIEGIQVSLTPGDVFTYSKPIDLNGKGKSDTLISLFALPKVQGYADVDNITIRLTDVNDENNYVEIRTFSNVNDLNEVEDLALYSNVRASNQSYYTGLHFWNWAVTDFPYEGVYYSLHQNVNYANPRGYPAYTASLTAKHGYGYTGEFYNSSTNKTFTGSPFSYSIDYAERKVYGYEQGGMDASNRLIADLDDTNFFDEVWNGFSTSKVYLSVYSTNVINDSFDFVITKIYNEDLSKDKYFDIYSSINLPVKPTVSVDDGYVIQNGKSEYSIVIPENAEAEEKSAASELQLFIKKATGARLTIIRDNETVAGGKYFSVGNTNLVTSDVASALTGLKSNGYVVKTVCENIFILGPSASGTLYAVYGYLKEEFNFEYYFTDVYDLDIKSNVELKSYNIFANPDINFMTTPSVGYIQRSDLNRQRFNAVPTNELFIPANGSTEVHNVLDIMPSDLATSHPTWFYTYTVNNTTRYAACFSAKNNSSEYALMQAHFFEVLKKGMMASDAEIFLISQPDNCGACTCGYCSGSNAIVKFADDLAGKVKIWLAGEGSEYTRDFKIYVMSYQETIEAPTISITNKDNLGVYIGYDGFGSSYSTSAYPNSSYINRAKAWAKKISNIGFWLYDVNFSSYLYPYDTSVYKQDFFKLMQELNVEFVNDQSQYENDENATAWNGLKAYISSKLRWDVNADVNALTANYFNACYGDAADIMLEVYNSQVTHWKNTIRPKGYTSKGDEGNIFGNLSQTKYWPQSTLEGWINNFKAAFVAIEPLEYTDKATYDRIHSMISAEIISPMALLIELYSKDATLVSEFKQYVKDSKVYYYAGGQGSTMTNLYEELGI